MAHITTEQLRLLLESEEPVPLLNVLPEEQFRAGHIPGSLNVPLDTPDFVSRVEDLVGGKTRQLVVYCQNEACTASTRAVRRLEEAGFREVYEYDGGIDAWRKAGHRIAQVQAV